MEKIQFNLIDLYSMNYCIVMKKSWFIFSRFMSFPSKLLKNIIIFSVHRRRPFRLTRKQAKKLITLFNVHTPLNVPQYQIAFYFRSKNSLIRFKNFFRKQCCKSMLPFAVCVHFGLLDFLENK